MVETITRGVQGSTQEYFTNDRTEEYNGFRLVATDPYGMWHVENMGGGPVADVLKGEWTGRYEAKKKIDWYVNTKKEIADKPPQDSNTKKVKEIMKERGAKTLAEALAGGAG